MLLVLIVHCGIVRKCVEDTDAFDLVQTRLSAIEVEHRIRPEVQRQPPIVAKPGDNRLGFVAELNRMGADIRNEGRHAVIRGMPRLSAAPVRALDVRAGAALVIAGLAAEGETVVLDPFHVDRGYSDLAASLCALGADVERVRDWR